MALNEGANEASRDPLRLHFICWPIGASAGVVLSVARPQSEGDELATVCDGETIRKVEPQEVAGRE